MITLLERFIANCEQTQDELRVELGLPDSSASRIFALVVFLCDDFLKIKEAEVKTADDLVSRGRRIQEAKYSFKGF